MSRGVSKPNTWLHSSRTEAISVGAVVVPSVGVAGSAVGDEPVSAVVGPGVKSVASPPFTVAEGTVGSVLPGSGSTRVGVDSPAAAAVVSVVGGGAVVVVVFVVVVGLVAVAAGSITTTVATAFLVAVLLLVRDFDIVDVV